MTNYSTELHEVYEKVSSLLYKDSYSSMDEDELLGIYDYLNDIWIRFIETEPPDEVLAKEVIEERKALEVIAPKIVTEINYHITLIVPKSYYEEDKDV